MSVLISGICMWVVGYMMIIWRDKRKFHRLQLSGIDSYWYHIYSIFVDNVLSVFGIFSIVMGSTMVLYQDYTEGYWLAILFVMVLFWLVYTLKIKL